MECLFGADKSECWIENNDSWTKLKSNWTKLKTISRDIFIPENRDNTSNVNENLNYLT